MNRLNNDIDIFSNTEETCVVEMNLFFKKVLNIFQEK